MSQTSLTTDTLFVRQINFKDQGNAPIPAGQVLYSRGDGGTYFGPPMSNLSTFPYGFRQFIGGSNLSTFATAAQPTLWLDQGAGIVFTQTMTGNTPHYYIAATAPEQLAIVGGGTLQFSSLTDELIGGRTLFFQGLGDTAISISDTTVVFQSVTVSSLSSLNELLSTQISVNQGVSSLVSTVDYQLSTINLFITSTGISTVVAELSNVQSNVDTVSTFVFSTFTGGTDAFGNRLYNRLNVDQISTNYLVTSTSIATLSYADTFQTGSTLLYDLTTTGDSNSFCAPIVSDGTVSTLTDFFIITDTITSNTRFAIEKQYLFSDYTDPYGNLVTTRGQQVQLGFLPTVSTQGGSLPPTVGEQFVPILQQLQVLQEQSNCGSQVVMNYVLKNTAKLDEVCATGDLWLNGSTVTISSLWVSSINGLTPGSGGGGGGGGNSTFLSTFSTLYVSTAYLETTVASSIQISTVMGQSLPILTMDAVNNRLGVNLGPSQQPRATLDVNGIVYAGNFVTTSDRRLKRNIRAAEFPPLIPVAYRYENLDTGEEDLGCMADEIAMIAPECVYTTPAGYKAVSYPKLVPVCLSLLRALTDRVAALEGQVSHGRLS